jgi:hypothetical protein
MNLQAMARPTTRVPTHDDRTVRTSAILRMMAGHMTYIGRQSPAAGVPRHGRLVVSGYKTYIHPRPAGLTERASVIRSTHLR